jgi:hypothetical protein
MYGDRWTQERDIHGDENGHKSRLVRLSVRGLLRLQRR